MEFEISTNLDTLRNQQIIANFDAVAAWLDEELAPYVGLVVTEDMIPSAKNYRANIRKVKERIEQYRKEAKNAALAPYNEFEQKCKVLTGKLDNAANNLDVQVKDFEKREAEAKIAEIKEVYDNSELTEAKDYCPWESILNPKWSNKGYSLEDAKEDVRAALFYADKNIESIREIGGEDTAYLLDYYKQCRDVNAVIRKSLEIKQAREREEQRRREEEERRRVDVEAAKEEKAYNTTTFFAEETKPIEEEMHMVDFRVWATVEQLARLKAFMKQNNIKYGRAT